MSNEALLDRYLRPAYGAYDARIFAAFETRWREALAFVVEKWPHVQSVADALWRKRVLTGNEVTEIIERVKTRTQTLPPYLAEELKATLSGRTEERG